MCNKNIKTDLGMIKNKIHLGKEGDRNRGTRESQACLWCFISLKGERGLFQIKLSLSFAVGQWAPNTSFSMLFCWHIFLKLNKNQKPQCVHMVYCLICGSSYTFGTQLLLIMFKRYAWNSLLTVFQSHIYTSSANLFIFK